jgi:hypothetical protein
MNNLVAIVFGLILIVVVIWTICRFCPLYREKPKSNPKNPYEGLSYEKQLILYEESVQNRRDADTMGASREDLPPLLPKPKRSIYDKFS